MRTFETEAELDSLGAIAEFVESELVDRGLSNDRMMEVLVALDEACANVIEHAYTSGGRIWVSVWDDGAVHIRVRDEGPEFNPLEQPEPDLTSDAEDRAVGGLGIHMIRNLVDELAYDRRDDGNEMTMVIYPYPHGEGGAER